jgi:hypothetical protein
MAAQSNLGLEIQERVLALGRHGYGLEFIPDPNNPDHKYLVTDANAQGIWLDNPAGDPKLGNLTIRIRPNEFKNYKADKHWVSVQLVGAAKGNHGQKI